MVCRRGVCEEVHGPDLVCLRVQQLAQGESDPRYILNPKP